MERVNRSSWAATKCARNRQLKKELAWGQAESIPITVTSNSITGISNSNIKININTIHAHQIVLLPRPLNLLKILRDQNLLPLLSLTIPPGLPVNILNPSTPKSQKSSRRTTRYQKWRRNLGVPRFRFRERTWDQGRIVPSRNRIRGLRAGVDRRRVSVLGLGLIPCNNRSNSWSSFLHRTWPSRPRKFVKSITGGTA